MSSSALDQYYADVIKSSHHIYISEHYQIVLFIVLLQCLLYFNLGINVGQRQK